MVSLDMEISIFYFGYKFTRSQAVPDALQLPNVSPRKYKNPDILMAQKIKLVIDFFQDKSASLSVGQPVVLFKYGCLRTSMDTRWMTLLRLLIY